MPFYDQLQALAGEQIQKKSRQKTHSDVKKALSHAGKGTPDDLMALLSPAAEKELETMARVSRELTLKRFGKTISLYIPLYLSNECVNSCVYCGFNHHNKMQRAVLTPRQTEEEAKQIRAMGFGHILMVTGEHPQKAGLSYLRKALHQLTRHFPLVSMEVQPLDTSEYQTLAREGLNTVYIYQETYHRGHYRHYHPAGPKADFTYRLETPERLGKAGIHKAGLGVLLGLEDWRTDSFLTGMHLRYLQKHYWRTQYSVSFPRLRPFAGNYPPNHPVSDRQLIQLITAYRLFDENVELALSTRESARFRDHAFQLGITSMSAGSSTQPGGYSNQKDQLEQFEVADNRLPAQIVAMLVNKGYEAVWKNWDGILQGGGMR